jgi:RNA polymerase sigma-70 factor (ECF subfamily)
MQRYQERVYWLIRRIVISHSDTDDLVQETFVKVWHKLPEFRGDSALFTWLYRVATNEALGFLRKKKRRFFVPIHDVNTELKETLRTEASPDGDEVSFKLQEALLDLPEKQRLVFTMKYFESMEYREISEVLGTSVGALKASYHHAVKKIKAKITDYEH